MPLARFSTASSPPRLGKVFDDVLIDLSVATPDLPSNMRDFLAAGESALDAFRSVGPDAPGRVARSDARLHAPLPDPQKFLAIGMNYREHVKEAREGGFAVPEKQLWFNKQVSCIVGPYDDVELPRVSDQLDYEVELGVVIGRACRHVPAEKARLVIGGYMVCNDVSVRDWQRHSPTHTIGKSFDTHGPCGPWLTLDHEISDPHSLKLGMTVNGEQRQSSSTDAMIHNVFEQIAYLSTVMTLLPGDILATGTPSGVGAAMKPPKFLRVGDVMRAEIEGLGYIENRVVAERAASAI
jgi:2-keto-4-pentenoate hydratase/2-oxohepta-3-ene-1,7-dioic acid hydratase in catechol pathway